MKECTTMAEIRKEIDRLDQIITPLLVERLGYIKQAGNIKQDRNSVRDDWRVEDVVNKVVAATRSMDGDAKMTEDVYRFLIEWSIMHEFEVYDALSDKGEKTN